MEAYRDSFMAMIERLIAKKQVCVESESRACKTVNRPALPEAPIPKKRLVVVESAPLPVPSEQTDKTPPPQPFEPGMPVIETMPLKAPH